MTQDKVERLNYSSAGAVRDKSKPRPEQHDAHVDVYIVATIEQDGWLRTELG